MSEKSRNDACVPLENNYFWVPVVFLQFVIVFLAFCSHYIFMTIVVRSHSFGQYTRGTFFLISLMMQVMLLTSTGAFLITLGHGKLIEDCVISLNETRKLLLNIHSFGEYFFVVSELLATIERVISTFSRSLRKSDVFMPIFLFGTTLGLIAAFFYIFLVRVSHDSMQFALGFGSLTLMEVLNGMIVFMLWYVAKKKYFARENSSLNLRYEFSRSYAYCRCAAASVTARVFIIGYICLKPAHVFDSRFDAAFYYIMNLFINLYCLGYPWTIMLYHRKIYSQIQAYLNQKASMLRSQRVKQKGDKNLYTIDGKQMNNMSSEDHFRHLDQFWNAASSPTPKRST